MTREILNPGALILEGHSGEERLQTRIPVLVAGLPGKMATLVAERLAQDEQFDLLLYAISSKRNRGTHLEFGDRRVDLIDYCPFDIKSRPGTIAVDFTNPQSAITNVILYTNFRIPFVMGTTVSDRKQIEEIVRNSEISAIVAPNMAASVVNVQNEFHEYLETSPNIFGGWTMTIRESHQATKKSVSGTAVAFQTQLEQLGARMESGIESIRDPELQRQLGIQNLDGHAYHWITLTSPNGEIKEYMTQIEGRQPYVEGTLMAIRFLGRQMRQGSRGQTFSMADVLGGGDTNG